MRCSRVQHVACVCCLGCFSRSCPTSYRFVSFRKFRRRRQCQQQCQRLFTLIFGELLDIALCDARTQWTTNIASDLSLAKHGAFCFSSRFVCLLLSWFVGDWLPVWLCGWCWYDAILSGSWIRMTDDVKIKLTKTLPLSPPSSSTLPWQRRKWQMTNWTEATDTWMQAPKSVWHRFGAKSDLFFFLFWLVYMYGRQIALGSVCWYAAVASDPMILLAKVEMFCQRIHAPSNACVHELGRLCEWILKCGKFQSMASVNIFLHELIHIGCTAYGRGKRVNAEAENIAFLHNSVLHWNIDWAETGDALHSDTVSFSISRLFAKWFFVLYSVWPSLRLLFDNLSQLWNRSICFYFIANWFRSETASAGTFGSCEMVWWKMKMQTHISVSNFRYIATRSDLYARKFAANASLDTYKRQGERGEEEQRPEKKMHDRRQTVAI